MVVHKTYFFFASAVLLLACTRQSVSEPQKGPSPALPRPFVAEGRTLGIRDEAMLEKLGSFFPRMQDGNPVNGLPRRIGLGTNERSILELVGDPDDLSYVLLLLGLPDDDPDTIIENSVIGARFLLNAVPGWQEEEVFELLEGAYKEIEDGGLRDRILSYEDRSIRIVFNETLGMLVLSVEPS